MTRGKASHPAPSAIATPAKKGMIRPGVTVSLPARARARKIPGTERTSVRARWTARGRRGHLLEEFVNPADFALHPTLRAFPSQKTIHRSRVGHPGEQPAASVRLA